MKSLIHRNHYRQMRVTRNQVYFHSEEWVWKIALTYTAHRLLVHSLLQQFTLGTEFFNTFSYYCEASRATASREV